MKTRSKLWLASAISILLFLGAIPATSQPARAAGTRPVIAQGLKIANRTRMESSPLTTISIYLPMVARNFCAGPLYADHFDDTATGWPILNDSYLQLEYLSGEYHFQVKASNYWSAATPGYTDSNYILATDVRNVTGAYGTYGLMFGISDDWTQFYVFEVDTATSYWIFRYDNGNRIHLPDGLTGHSSSYIYSGTATNRLKVERNGSSITLYANGHLLMSVSDGTYTGSRRVGVTASSYSVPNLDARFDNFTVYSSSCDAAAVLDLENVPSREQAAGSSVASNVANIGQGLNGPRPPLP